MPEALVRMLGAEISWPALNVAAPLALALAAVLAGRRGAALIWAAGPAMLVLAGVTALQAAQHGPLAQAVGGWPAPLGIVLRVDGLAAAFVVATAAITALVGLYAHPMFSGSAAGRRGGAFWPLFYTLWAALNAVFLSADLFNLYVALELLTLAAVGLVAVDGRGEVLRAALRYLMFGLFGSLAYLIGAALLYAAYATLDMRLLAGVAGPGPATWAAGALMSVGLMAKTALFPFHAWLPPAHAGAAAPVSALLSGLVTKASFYIALRLWFEALPTVATAEFSNLLGLAGAGGILFGSVLALRQRRLKLLIAYSTVAQVGYLFLVLPLAGGAGEAQPWATSAWSGAVFHALSHAAAKAALFLAAGVMVWRIGSDRLEDLAGLGRTLPLTTFAFGLAALSLMGLPPSGGFIGKYLLLTAAFAGGEHLWAAVIIVGGLLAAAYLFRPLNRLLAAAATPLEVRPAPLVLRLAPLALALLAVVLGIASLAPYEFIQIGRPWRAEEGLP